MSRPSHWQSWHTWAQRNAYGGTRGTTWPTPTAEALAGELGWSVNRLTNNVQRCRSLADYKRLADRIGVSPETVRAWKRRAGRAAA